MPHDAGEISFYDELGVAPDASAQEIRDAFRLHVRLLHPDHQTDPQLKELADRQMQKLNRIYAILADPARRRAYDLAGSGVDPIPPRVTTPLLPFDFRHAAGKMPWAAAILVSTAVLIWLAYEGTPAQNHFDSGSVQATGASTQAPASTGPAEDSDSSAKQIARLQAELRMAAAERDAARHELANLRGTRENGKTETDTPTAAFDFTPPASAVSSDSPAAPIAAASAPVTAAAKPVTSGPLNVAGAPVQHAAHVPNRRLAGFWFYAVPPEGQQNKNHSLYLPEYIEATISEDNGTVRGRYRSRFVITDRAITPDVNFTFTGTLNGTQCNCEWTGGGGAKGTVTLKLTGENSMKIDWAASELGSLGLASGTAILTRKIE